MPAFFSQPGTVEGCRMERVCFISEGKRSVSASSAGLGYVGFEYVLCRGPRPGRWDCGGLEGEGWLEDAEGGLGASFGLGERGGGFLCAGGVGFRFWTGEGAGYDVGEPVA